jgi:hypothetical protein
MFDLKCFSMWQILKTLQGVIISDYVVLTCFATIHLNLYPNRSQLVFVVVLSVGENIWPQYGSEIVMRGVINEIPETNAIIFCMIWHPKGKYGLLLE